MGQLIESESTDSLLPTLVCIAKPQFRLAELRMERKRRNKTVIGGDDDDRLLAEMICGNDNSDDDDFGGGEERDRSVRFVICESARRRQSLSETNQM